MRWRAQDRNGSRPVAAPSLPLIRRRRQDPTPQPADPAATLRFLERQYERALVALSEISSGRHDPYEAVQIARRTIRVGHEAEALQLRGAP